MTPEQVAIPAIGLLTGTLDSAKPEAVGAVIVRWHHVHSPDAWAEIRLGDFTDFMRVDVVCQDWSRNPIWCHAFLYGIQPMLDRGFLEGWVQGDADSIGRVTPAFVAKLEGSHWDRSELVDDRTCRACGCTNDRACEEGCHWVEPDLCSACEEMAHG